MATLDSVTIENFRCFTKKQTVRLTPLTLLMGDNGSGKTSFLDFCRTKICQDVLLLEQPEERLHPSLQANLGSLFCRIASGLKWQVIVETHSDYLMDRVRMEIRDKKVELKPEDVSILFFKRRLLHSEIHSISFDQQGNILNPPDGYREFFINEMSRSVRPKS